MSDLWLPFGVLARYERDYPKGGPKGYAPWKPDHRTARLRGEIIEVLDNYESYWPLGPRQTGYITIGRYGYDKGERHMDKVGYVLERGRRSGVIPWEAIADGWTPNPLAPLEFDSPADFCSEVLALAQNYSSPLLAGQKVVVEVWVETASLAPQVVRVAHRYGVTVYPSSGDSALSAKRQLVLRAVRRWAEQGVITVVLHIGDYDHKGVGVYRALEADVLAFIATGHCDDDLSRAEAEALASSIISFERVAITPLVVQRYHLSTDDVKLPKNGAMPPGPALPYNCQAEALAPEQLEQLLVEAIEAHLDLDVSAEAQSRSGSLRQWAVEQANTIRPPG
jgi:hypothetical protein